MEQCHYSFRVNVDIYWQLFIDIDNINVDIGVAMLLSIKLWKNIEPRYIINKYIGWLYPTLNFSPKFATPIIFVICVPA